MRAGYIFTDFPINSQENGIRSLKCTSFIIIDKEYGPILFDTGSVYDTQTLLTFLKNQIGLEPDDIRWVFNTHIHPDHTGANRFFRKAKLIFSRKDYEFANDIANTVFEGRDLLSYLHTNCPGYIKSFNQFDANSMQKYIEEHWSDKAIGIDLNPDYIEDSPEIPNFIKIIPSFGHTFYHYSFLVETSTLKIFIAGDALSMRMILKEENNEDRFLEPHMDFNLYFKTLENIRRFNGLIVPGHDRPFYTTNFRAIRKNSFFIKELVCKC